MNLLEFLGINPKEQEKVEAKIGLELAISGRLEHKVKTLLRERIDGFKVEDMDEQHPPLEYCRRAMKVNGGKHCLECHDSEKYGYCCQYMAENGIYDEIYGRCDEEEEYPHTTDWVRFGECEAHFFMVCPALEVGDKQQEVCVDCPLRDEVFQELAEKEITKGSRDKDQQSLSKYLPYSDYELNVIQLRVDNAVKAMGLMEHRINKGVKTLLEDCLAQEKGDCDDCPFEDICH